MDPMAGALLLGLSLLSGGVIGWAILKGRQRTAALKAVVAARGWRWTEGPGALRIEGGDEVPWMLEQVRARGQGSGRRPPRWVAPAAPTDHAVLLGPVADMPSTAAALQGGLAQMLLRLILGPRADELVGARVLDGVGSEAFRARYTVVGTDPATARDLVTPEVEQALLSAPVDRMAVLRWRDELQLLLLSDALDATTAVALVDTGEAVARSCGFGEA